MPSAAPPRPAARAAGAPPTPDARGGSGGETSVGLSPRKAALLAYSAGWVSGLLLLWLEGRSREVRFHAAQSLLAFGVLTLVGVLLLGLAGVGLLTSLQLFRISLWAGQGLVAAGVLLWLYALVRVAAGGSPRWPVVAARADRLAGR